MTILEMQIIMHYWCQSDICDYDYDTQAGNAAMEKFLKHGIIKMNYSGRDSKYIIDAVVARPYIDAITSVPLPAIVWAVPDYEIKRY